ncbi:MAG: hypothetical protein WA417_05245 [Stellaceae bacterium]
MSKRQTVTLCGCLAALPLLMGCANGGGGQQSAYAPPAPVATAPPAGPDIGARVYAVGPGAPAAILVMLPGPGDMLAADPQLWAAQGFDVVTPPASELYRIVAEQQAAAAQLVAQARAIADAPIWLMGRDPAIEAAMAPAVAGQVSGLVVTSTASGAGSCSERMIYSYSGNGAPPKVAVSKSGDACPAGPPFGEGTNPATAPSLPQGQPRGPHLIEASAGSAAAPAARRAAVERIAEAIKSTPQS